MDAIDDAIPKNPI